MLDIDQMPGRYLEDSQCGSAEAVTPPQVWMRLIGNRINCHEIPAITQQGAD